MRVVVWRGNSGRGFGGGQAALGVALIAAGGALISAGVRKLYNMYRRNRR